MNREELCNKLNEYFENHMFEFIPSVNLYSIEKKLKDDSYIKSSFVSMTDKYYDDLISLIEKICGDNIKIQFNNTGSTFSLWGDNKSYFSEDEGNEER